jgi:putative flippase GtrA
VNKVHGTPDERGFDAMAVPGGGRDTAAERSSPRGRLVRLYQKMPEKVRMVTTAVIGALLGLITYEIIYALNPFTPRAPTSWALAFAIGIARQHALHRWLTFTYRTPYWRSLRRAYVMYSGSALVGTLLDWVLTQWLGVNHRVAWLICLMSTATISLVFLRRYVFGPGIIPS